MRLNMFDCTIIYRKGSQNQGADALSRLCEELNDEDTENNENVVINSIVSNKQAHPDTRRSHTVKLESQFGIHDNILQDNETKEVYFMLYANEELRKDQQEDADLKWLYELKMQAKAQNQDKPDTKKEAMNQQQFFLYRQWDRIFVFDGILYRQWVDKKNKTSHLQYIAPTAKRRQILERSHDSVESGHLGANKTIERIRQNHYWPKWEEEASQYSMQTLPRKQDSKQDAHSTTGTNHSTISIRHSGI